MTEEVLYEELNKKSKRLENLISTARHKIQQFVKCAICLGPYTNPKTLKCLHTFCKICLKRILQTGNSNRHTVVRLKCPKCRKKTRIPNGNLKMLPVIGEVKELLDLKKDLMIEPQIKFEDKVEETSDSDSDSSSSSGDESTTSISDNTIDSYTFSEFEELDNYNLSTQEGSSDSFEELLTPEAITPNESVDIGYTLPEQVLPMNNNISLTQSSESNNHTQPARFSNESQNKNTTIESSEEETLRAVQSICSPARFTNSPAVSICSNDETVTEQEVLQIVQEPHFVSELERALEEDNDKNNN